MCTCFLLWCLVRLFYSRQRGLAGCSTESCFFLFLLMSHYYCSPMVVSVATLALTSLVNLRMLMISCSLHQKLQLYVNDYSCAMRGDSISFNSIETKSLAVGQVHNILSNFRSSDSLVQRKFQSYCTS